MGFSLGLIGLPNVGKSTLFSALSKNAVDIQNYPFTTINPNIGVVNVPDERLAFIHEVLKSKKRIPTFIEFYDIAGLVKGAHKGEGLGNQFLSYIRTVDAIAHVIRCFPLSQITHVYGKIDPIADIEIIETELIFSDLETVNRKISTLRSQVKTGDKKSSEKLTFFENLKTHLEKGLLAKDFEHEFTEDITNEISLLTIKPVIYIANIDETGNKDQVDRIKEFAQKRKAPIVPICSKLELELSDMEENEAKEYRIASGLNSGLSELITAGYKLLDLITFFTSNNKESHAWTINRNGKAIEAAAKIHSDMARGFIAVDVIHFDDLKRYPSIEALKQHGLLHLEGKEYKVQDGDLIYIRFKV